MKIPDIEVIRHGWNYEMCLENEEAFVAYDTVRNEYVAACKEQKGWGYGLGSYYYNIVCGDFKKCKKYFEKYSPKSMEIIKQMTRG